MTLTGTASHKAGPGMRPCCPSCKSFNLHHHPRSDTWRCYSCHNGFKYPEYREPLQHRGPTKKPLLETRPKAPIPDGPYRLPEKHEREQKPLSRPRQFEHWQLCMMIKR